MQSFFVFRLHFFFFCFVLFAVLFKVSGGRRSVCNRLLLCVYVNSVTINAHRVKEGYLVYNEEEAGQKLFRFMRQSLFLAPKLEGGILRAHTRTFARFAPTFGKEQTLFSTFYPSPYRSSIISGYKLSCTVASFSFEVNVWLCSSSFERYTGIEFQLGCLWPKVYLHHFYFPFLVTFFFVFVLLRSWCHAHLRWKRLSHGGWLVKSDASLIWTERYEVLV